MTTEELKETVVRSGERAMRLTGKEPVFESGAAEWMQVKMLAEIAYQLAVINERNALEDERLGDRVEGISISVTALESRIDKLTGYAIANP